MLKAIGNWMMKKVGDRVFFADLHDLQQQPMYMQIQVATAIAQGIVELQEGWRNEDTQALKQWGLAFQARRHELMAQGNATVASPEYAVIAFLSSFVLAVMPGPSNSPGVVLTLCRWILRVLGEPKQLPVSEKAVEIADQFRRIISIKIASTKPSLSDTRRHVFPNGATTTKLELPQCPPSASSLPSESNAMYPTAQDIENKLAAYRARRSVIAENINASVAAENMNTSAKEVHCPCCDKQLDAIPDQMEFFCTRCETSFTRKI